MAIHRILFVLSIAVVSFTAIRADDDKTDKADKADKPAPILHVKVGKAPPMRELPKFTATDLQPVDDVHPMPEMDSLIIRRGNQFLLLPMVPPFNEKPLAKDHRFDGATIIQAYKTDDAFWLLLQDSRGDDGARVPLLFDVNRKRATVPLPKGFTSKPGMFHEVRHCATAPGGGGFLFGVGGQSNKGWVRDGSHQVYFWQPMTGGDLRRIPVGFDLAYFSADRGVAVFQAPYAGDFRNRALVAMSMTTGDYLHTIPNRRDEPWVHYNWSDPGDVQPLRGPVGEKADRNVVGVSAVGQALPLDLKIDADLRVDLSVRADTVALRHAAKSGQQPSELLVAPLRENAEPHRVASQVSKAVPIGEGRVAFAVTQGERNKQRDEAFCYDLKTNRVWNLLDAGPRPSALAPELAALPYIVQRTTVTFTAGFGQPGDRGRLTLARYEHHQMDMRALLSSDSRTQPRVDSVTWRRQLLITADGARFVGEFLTENDHFESYFLQNAGVILAMRRENQQTLLRRYTFAWDDKKDNEGK